MTTRQGRGGFTLMEMLVVVAIIIIIAGAATPLVLNYLHNARIDRAKMDIKTIEKAVVAYELQVRRSWPNDLTVLTQPDPNYNTLPLLSPQAIIDPWGQGYSTTPAR